MYNIYTHKKVNYTITKKKIATKDRKITTYEYDKIR